MANPGMHFREWCSVEAPARLHLGFLDLHGGLGRRFGSIGLTLGGLTTRLCAARSAQLTVRGEQRERALYCVRALMQECGVTDGIDLHVEKAIPQHIGLGSGTQLGLAVGVALSRLFDLELTPRDVAGILERGARSGIGIGAFEAGGFIVDGGRGRDDAPPPIVSRLEFPQSWRVLLVFDQRLRGLHGASETEAFHKLPPFPESCASHCCHLLLMQALPALAQADIATFGAAVSELQRIVGDYFAPVQGGRFTSPSVSRVLALLEAEGVACVGQSSWGPTGFAIFESEQHAGASMRLVQERFRDEAGLEFRLVSGRNYGAETWLQRERSGLRGSLA
jgi:beta-RFAP synthase